MSLSYLDPSRSGSPRLMESNHKRKNSRSFKKASTTSIQNKTLQFVSNLCCFLFLSFLMCLSIIKYVYVHYIIQAESMRSEPIRKKAFPTDYKYLQRKPDLSYYCQLLGLQLFEYRVTTHDGFILSLYRLVDPKSINKEKKPVLCLHGLLQSSGAYITSGYKSIAYSLIENGYDVWLANSRCGFEPRHLNYTKDDPEMWNWDLTDMAKYDLTCFIDEVLNVTEHSGPISLIGHSQGTAQIAMLISNELSLGYNDKIDKVVLLAPAIFGGPLLNEKLFIKFIQGIPNFVYNLFFGMNAFMPIMLTLRNIIVDTPIFGFCSYTMFNFLFDWNDELWDPSLRDIHFMFSPVYVSSKLMKWWLSNTHGQGFESGKPILKSDGCWFNSNCPSMMLIIGGKDDLVNGELLIDKLNGETFMKSRFSYLKIDEYSHVDVLWADDLLERVGGDMLNFLED